MGISQIRNAQIKDNTITREKLVLDFLAGANLNLTNGNNDATITGLIAGVNANDAVNVAQLSAAIAALTGVKTLRGPIAAPADLTANSTGNAYADGVNEYKSGDVFQITANGDLTLSDGVLSVNNGDEIVILNDKADGALTLADVFKIDNTESVDIVRTANVVDNLTSTSITNVLSANQGRVLDEKIAALADEVCGEVIPIANDNDTGTLAFEPQVATLKVYLNGLRAEPSQYTVSGPTNQVITLTDPTSLAGDCLIVDYRKA